MMALCKTVQCEPRAFILQILAFVAICATLWEQVGGQIPYTRHLSALRIQELHNIAHRLEKSVDPEKYACDSFYEFVCGRHVPLFSMLGNMPLLENLIQLQAELENDSQQFAAKQKMLDFFISCNTRKSVEQCYRQTFIYFRPLFGYVITKHYIDGSAQDHENFMSVLESFLSKTQNAQVFTNNPIRNTLVDLKREFRYPRNYFHVRNLNAHFQSLQIYRDSYEHNVRNLELYRKLNSTFETGIPRTILDWSVFVYQSRHKPMSYYYATLTPHLWMALYNVTDRYNRPLYFQQTGECLKLSQFVNMLEEARIMAIIYLKSFRNAWQDYRDWIMGSSVNQEIFDHENEILRKYRLDNKRLFFTFYGQNFCDFGKELAENVFYLGLKESQDFYSAYSCGYQTVRQSQCEIL